jgi:exopolysaccharide production protein ExoF
MQSVIQPKSRAFASCLRAIVMAALLVTGLTFAVSATEPYKLGVSDKITVRVVEWQSAGATFQDWTAVAGDYLVGPDGSIAFPFVGDVAAAGKTTSELAKALGSGLRTTLGLTDPPNVTIEVATFGPVYVTGDVQAPGAYAFAPGLNVLKAVSLAGGARRGSADPGARGDRDLIGLQGAYQVLRDQRTRLLIQRARLDATLARQASLSVPAEVKDDAATPRLVATATAMLKASDDQLNDQVGALDAQKQLLTKGIDTLAQKREAAAQQLALAQDRLKKVQGLADNGLAITDRVVTLQSSVADLEGRLLDIDTADLKAQQDISVAENQGQKLVSDELIQASRDRQDVDAQLAETELKMATQQQLIEDAIANGATPAAPGVAGYTYSILRDGTETDATKTDALRPGDVVTVTLTLNP